MPTSPFACFVDVTATRDYSVSDSGIDESSNSTQLHKIAELRLSPAVPGHDDSRRESINCHRDLVEARTSDSGNKLRMDVSPLVISPRILTRSERNFTRLRIWLAHRAYKSFPRGGACRFGPRSVLKLSPYTRAAEAANIQYIIRNTTIPVPHIQDVFAIERRTFIVMDYINAPELTFVNNLSFEQEEGIFSQLKDYISQMRSLQPPKHGRLEAVDGSGLYDVRLAGEPFPPFASVEEFHERLGHEVVLKSQIHSHMWLDFEAIAKRRYRLKFTHGDIAPRNILVKNGRIVAIIDWESAGWYPEYWEYTRWASSNYISSQKWHDMRDVILDRYPDELRVDEYLETVFTRL